MPINLSKGQKVDLTKKNPGLILTWMQQHLCLVPTENALQRKNSFSMAI